MLAVSTIDDAGLGPFSGNLGFRIWTNFLRSGFQDLGRLSAIQLLGLSHSY